MSSALLRWLLVAILASFGVKVFAHARIKPSGSLMPRSNDPGLKQGPCGGVMKSVSPPVFAPGATITVQWEETIDHPGRYEFYFSQADDTNFGPALKVVPDTQNTPVVGGNYHQYSTTITLPDVQCANCTLQMIQYMTETNPPSLYFSCADLSLQAGGVGPSPSPSPVPTPVPLPAPSPSPPSNCH